MTRKRKDHRKNIVVLTKFFMEEPDGTHRLVQVTGDKRSQKKRAYYPANGTVVTWAEQQALIEQNAGEQA